MKKEGLSRIIINDKKLTNREQIFATENHNLIYNFINLKSICIDDFYDIVVFGYLRAVKKYYKNPAIWKYEFSTIAFKEMNGELINHFEKNKNNKNNIYILNQNEIIEVTTELDDVLLTHEIKKLLTSEEFLVYQAKLSGMSIKEISIKFGFTYYRANEKLKMIKGKIKPLLD